MESDSLTIKNVWITGDYSAAIYLGPPEANIIGNWFPIPDPIRDLERAIRARFDRCCHSN